MDLKKLGSFVLLIGLLIAVYGGIQIATNLPVRAKLSGRSGIGNYINDTNSIIDANYKNFAREANRKFAVKVILGGGLVALLGVGIRSSTTTRTQAAQR